MASPTATADPATTRCPADPAGRDQPADPQGDTGLDAVTGAFSYSGRAIARRVSAEGRRLRTLTGHPERGAADDGVEVYPLSFDELPALVRSLDGVTTLYNTYWIRFGQGRMDHSVAVENSRTLFAAAKRAGVGKIVHVSILHPSADSPYPYFRGKALVERSLAATGLPYAILRPSVLFDEDGVLLNNIAWLLRHFPVFGVGGGGRYRVRPVHVDDLAELSVTASRWTDDRIVDAVGPERPSFIELVEQLRHAVGSRSRVVRLPGVAVLGMSRLLGTMLRDVVLTADEYHSMAEGLADSDAPTTGPVALSEWIADHADSLGRHYRNELDRHFR